MTIEAIVALIVGLATITEKLLKLVNNILEKKKKEPWSLIQQISSFLSKNVWILYFLLVLSTSVAISTWLGRIAIERHERALVLFMHARDTFLKGEYNRAEEEFLEALALAPNSFSLQQGLGDVHRALGELPEAEDRYRRALEISPNASSALYRLAIALYNQGKFEEAEESMRKVIDSGEKTAKVYYTMASIFYLRWQKASAWEENGDFKKAVDYYNKCLQSEARYWSPWCHYDIGCLHALRLNKRGLGDDERATLEGEAVTAIETALVKAKEESDDMYQEMVKRLQGDPDVENIKEIIEDLIRSTHEQP